MSRFSVHRTPVNGVCIIERCPIEDSRGSLTRLFCGKKLAEVGWITPIAQINHTVTALAGTLRGMHFQYSPFGEMKLVMCLRGEVFDVAADIRRSSPTLLQHAHVKLSASNKKAILIPEGCAHGFQALTDEVEMLYMHSAPHVPSAEGGIHPQDTKLGIEWPLPISAMSDRDKRHPWLNSDFEGIDP